MMMKLYNATLQYWQGLPSKIAKILCPQSQEYKSFEIIIHDSFYFVFSLSVIQFCFDVKFSTSIWF